MNKELIPIFNTLNEAEQNTLKHLTEELKDAYFKRQIFRTETEARISVLNDGEHPTNASKYWQAVREQTMMLDQLAILSFEMRRHETKLEKLRRKLLQTTDELEKEEIQIDIDEITFFKIQSQQNAKDRVREIQMWSTLKAEVNDGSFDTQHVNTHQLESYRKILENRARVASNSSSPSELMNIAGPLSTVKKQLKQTEKLTL